METLIIFLKENWGTIITCCGVLGIGLEVAPIEIRPVSWCLKRIGSIMNEDIIAKVNNLEAELHNLRKEEDMERINNIRKEIVDFSLSCQRDEHHTRDEYDRIFERVNNYHVLMEKYKKENGKIDIEVSYINKVYSECLEKRKFFEG